jgi:murein DD-endopeptidase MepM/ murein hydrolase activator NlpD
MDPMKNFYSKILNAKLQHFPKGHIAAASILGGGLCLILAGLSVSNTESSLAMPQTVKIPITNKAPLLINNKSIDSANPTTDSLGAINVPLDISEIAQASQDNPPALVTTAHTETPVTAPEIQEYVVKNGDSLSVIFKRIGLSDRDLYELFNESPEAKELRHIVPGQKIAVELNAEGKLQQLVYTEDTLNSLSFTRTTDGFTSKKIERQPDIQIAFRQAKITSSLFMAGKNAGMSSNMVMELANIFAWDIDFAQDIRRDDHFKIMYEEKYLDGKKIGNGAILAVEFVNQNNTFEAVRYTDKEGHSSYYTPEGESMRKAFLRMPVDLARISSHFNLNRKHPILHTIRAHKGTDYAAPRGTPIKAAGDGKVIHAGRKGGFGNTVVIQHGQGYETLYAHMHNFGRNIKTGTRVRQGQIIGYVGTTGLSSGPHLHYEFHVNGVPRNPMTIQLPKAISIAASEKSRFLAQTQPTVAQLQQFNGTTRLAMANSESDEH